VLSCAAEGASATSPPAKGAYDEPHVDSTSRSHAIARSWIAGPSDSHVVNEAEEGRQSQRTCHQAGERRGAGAGCGAFACRAAHDGSEAVVASAQRDNLGGRRFRESRGPLPPDVFGGLRGIAPYQSKLILNQEAICLNCLRRETSLGCGFALQGIV